MTETQLTHVAVVGGSRRTGALVAALARDAGADVDTVVRPGGDLDGVVVVPRAGADSIDALVREVVSALPDAAVPIVLVSSFVVGHGLHHALNCDAGRFRDRVAAEQRLRDASTPHVIVRSTWLVDDPPRLSALRLTQDAETDGLVARADVARVCVAALTVSRAWGTTFALYAEPGPPTDLTEAFAALAPDETR